MEYVEIAFTDVEPFEGFWSCREDCGDYDLLKQKTPSGDVVWASSQQLCGLEEEYENRDVWIVKMSVFDYPIVVLWIAFFLFVLSILLLIFFR